MHASNRACTMYASIATPTMTVALETPRALAAFVYSEMSNASTTDGDLFRLCQTNTPRALFDWRRLHSRHYVITVWVRNQDTATAVGDFLAGLAGQEVKVCRPLPNSFAVFAAHGHLFTSSPRYVLPPFHEPFDVVLEFLGSRSFLDTMAYKLADMAIPPSIVAYKQGSVCYVHSRQLVDWQWPLRLVLPGFPGGPEAPDDVFMTPQGTTRWGALPKWTLNTVTFVFIAVDTASGRADPGSAGITVVTQDNMENNFYPSADMLPSSLCSSVISTDYFATHLKIDNIKLLVFDRSSKDVLGLLLAHYVPGTKAVRRSLVCSLLKGAGTLLASVLEQLAREMVGAGNPIDQLQLNSMPTAITFHERTGYRFRKSCEPEDRPVPSNLPQPLLDGHGFVTDAAIDGLMDLKTAGFGLEGCVLQPGKSPRENWYSQAGCRQAVFPMRRCLEDAAVHGGRRRSRYPRLPPRSSRRFR